MYPENKFAQFPTAEVAGHQAVASALGEGNTLSPDAREALGIGVPAGAVRGQAPQLEDKASAGISLEGGKMYAGSGAGDTLQQLAAAAGGAENVMPAALQKPENPYAAVAVGPTHQPGGP